MQFEWGMSRNKCLNLYTVKNGSLACMLDRSIVATEHKRPLRSANDTDVHNTLSSQWRVPNAFFW